MDRINQLYFSYLTAGAESGTPIKKIRDIVKFLITTNYTRKNL